MLIQTSVGQPTTQTVGATPNLRSGKQGDVILSELHSRYYEQTYNGNSFFVASQAVATTVADLPTIQTGLILSNPIGSVINVVINKTSFNQSIIQSVQVEAYSLAVGYSATTQVTHTAAAITHTSKIGSGLTSVAKADTSATVPTAPVYSHFIGATSTATADATFGFVDLEGSIILMPGAYIYWATTAQASVAGMWFSFAWEEVPI